MAADPIEALAHDHRGLTERVFALRAELAAYEVAGVHRELARRALVRHIEQLRDELLTHFAVEEEGLFPFVDAHAPDLQGGACALRDAHEVVCGAASRLLYLAQRSVDARGATPGLWTAYERFEMLYGAHSRDELEFLAQLDERLGAAPREALRALLGTL